MFSSILLKAALTSSVVLGGVAYAQSSRAARVEDQNRVLEKSMAALEAKIERSALARDVEAARAERWRERAAELDASIEALFTEDIPDVPLDPRIIAFLDGLREVD